MRTGPDHKGSSDQTTIIYILSRAGTMLSLAFEASFEKALNDLKLCSL